MVNLKQHFVGRTCYFARQTSYIHLTGSIPLPSIACLQLKGCGLNHRSSSASNMLRNLAVEVKISSAHRSWENPIFWGKKNGKLQFCRFGGLFSLSLSPSLCLSLCIYAYMYIYVHICTCIHIYMCVCVCAYNCTLEKDSRETLLSRILVARMMSSRGCGLQWWHELTTDTAQKLNPSPPISWNLLPSVNV